MQSAVEQRKKHRRRERDVSACVRACVYVCVCVCGVVWCGVDAERDQERAMCVRRERCWAELVARSKWRGSGKERDREGREGRASLQRQIRISTYTGTSKYHSRDEGARAREHRAPEIEDERSSRNPSSVERRERRRGGEEI